MFSCHSASVLFYPVRALVQTRWLFCILFHFPFPCRVPLAKEAAFSQAHWTGNAQILLQKVVLHSLPLWMCLDLVVLEGLFAYLFLTSQFCPALMSSPFMLRVSNCRSDRRRVSTKLFMSHSATSYLLAH